MLPVNLPVTTCRRLRNPHGRRLVHRYGQAPRSSCFGEFTPIKVNLPSHPTSLAMRLIPMPPARSFRTFFSTLPFTLGRPIALPCSLALAICIPRDSVTVGWPCDMLVPELRGAFFWHPIETGFETFGYVAMICSGEAFYCTYFAPIRK